MFLLYETFLMPWSTLVHVHITNKSAWLWLLLCTLAWGDNRAMVVERVWSSDPCRGLADTKTSSCLGRSSVQEEDERQLSLYWWQLLFSSPTYMGPQPSYKFREWQRWCGDSPQCAAAKGQKHNPKVIKPPIKPHSPPPRGSVSILSSFLLNLSRHLLAWRQARTHKSYSKQTLRAPAKTVSKMSYSTWDYFSAII